MALLVTLLVSLLFGVIAYFVSSLFPFTKRYAEVIGLVVALLVFLSRLGAL